MEAGVQTRGFAAVRVRGAGPGTLAFAVALLVSSGLLLSWLSELTFWRDEWAFILDRRGSGLDVYLTPFVEQLLALAVALYKGLIAAFGIDSPLPFQIVHTLVYAATMLVVFVYLRRRVGEWLAFAATLPILFLGPSWDDLLFPFQVSLIGALACGVGALLALDNRTRRGDVIATVLLAIGLFCQHAAIPFVIAATIDIAFTRERFRRAYVVVLPTVLWFAWYVGWGRDAQNFVSFQNFQTEFGYVADGLSSSLSSLVGLAVPRDEMPVTPLDWGRPLLLIALGFGIWRVATAGVRAISPRLWAVIAAQLSFWTLTGLNASFFGQATSGRYQLVGVVLWVMIAAELLRGVAVSRRAVAIVVAAATLAALANFSQLKLTATNLSTIADQERGALAALELMRGQVADDFVLTEENSGVDYLGIVDAGSYFSAVDDFGSPADTPAELAGAPEAGRVSADMVFAAGLGIKAAPAAAAGACADVDLGQGAQTVPVPPGGLVVDARGGDAALHLRRYASLSYPVGLGRVEEGERVQIAIPPDGSDQPWTLQLTGSGTVAACRPEAGS
jgi:hypothetical protein